MTAVKRDGFTRLGASSARDGSHRLNIIFVHGLRGHPKHTWGGDSVPDNRSETGTILRSTSRDLLKRIRRRYKPAGSNKTEARSSRRNPFWPEEYLANDIPEARIWTYGYNADIIESTFRTSNNNNISSHGRDLAVRFDRDVDNEDPVVFIAHSLGGIIVKDAIHKSEPCRTRTRLIVFLGTPHRGSAYAGWGQIASNLARLALQDSNKKILESLKVDSEVLDNIQEEFKTIAHECALKIHSFQEAQGSSGIKGFDGKVVDNFSSKVDLPRTHETVESMDADHRQMVRCTDKSDARYHAVVGVLKKFILQDLRSLEPAPPASSSSSQPECPSCSEIKIAQQLIEKGANIHAAKEDGRTSLHEASWNGYEAVARLLIKNGANVNAAEKNGRTPLDAASHNGYEAVVRLLLDKGANAKAALRDGWTSLHSAAWRGHKAVAQLLLERGANARAARKDGRTPLHAASQNGHEAVVQLLLKSGADTEATEKDRWNKEDGCTPLLVASNSGHEIIAQQLIEKGANIHAAKEDGRTPLHAASWNGYEAVARLLIKNGANVNAAKKNGRTPLHAASYNGHEAVVRLLLESGADTEATETDGCTPLHLASMNGHEAVAQRLLERGANAEAAPKDGWTP